MVHWVENFTARVAGDDMDPQKGVAKLLEFLLRDIEGGRTLPEGWDAGSPKSSSKHPTIAAIAEKNKAERWDFVRAREWLTEQVSLKQTTIAGRCRRSASWSSSSRRTSSSTSSSSTP
jgi:hypothetical protein